MKKFVLMLFCFSSSYIVSGQNVKFELIYYDDGFPETGGYQEEPGNEIALKFTPSNYPYFIEKAYINFVNYSSSFTDSIYVKIYDDNGNDNTPGNLLFKKKITPITTSIQNVNYWYDLELSNHGIIINDGSFYISVSWISPYSPEVGIDTDIPFEQRTWIFENNTWSQLSDIYPSHANDQLMIRTLGVNDTISILHELSYDDGLPDVSNYQQIIDDKIALGFIPEHYPYDLLGAFINITNYGGNETDSIKLQIFNDANSKPDKMLCEKIIINNSHAQANTNSNYWYFIDLSKENIHIDSGNFYIALSWLVSASPNIGADKPNLNHQVWIYENDNWSKLESLYPSAADESIMIRPIYSYVNSLFLTITPPNQNVSPSAGNISFDVSSNVEWNVTVDAGWLRVDKINDSSVKVDYDENTKTDSRTAILTFMGEGVSDQTVTVIQAGVDPILSVSPANRDVDPEAGYTTFDVHSNTEWTVEDDADWLMINPSYGNNEAILFAEFSENTSGESRMATITVSSSGLQASATVKQEGIITGIIDEDESNAVKLYPNPSENEITVVLNRSNKIIRLEVYNSLGVRVKEFSNIDSNETVLDVSELNQGLYNLVIEDEDRFIIKRVVKL